MTNQDLLLSCPGAAGSPNVERADRCTLINIVNNPDTRVWSVIGDPQLNCEGGTNPIQLTIGGSTTISSSTTADVDLGIDFDGISIGGGVSTDSGTEQTASNSTQITINPNRQVVQAVGVLSHSQSGNIQVNYGDRVDGHFIWFTDAVLTQLTPTSDLEFDVHETACVTLGFGFSIDDACSYAGSIIHEWEFWTLNAVNSFVPPNLQRPRVGIICGSGLSGFAGSLRDSVAVDYKDIPGFAKSTVPGHKSALAFGFMGSGDGVPVVAMLGRDTLCPLSFILYERSWRTQSFFGYRDKLRVVVVQDHIALPNLTGLNPLLGPQWIDPERVYPRFLPLSDAYSRSLRKLVFRAAHALSLPLNTLGEGTYAWVSGPTYETPAEGRFLRAAGADVVGMSTAPEVVVAEEEGMCWC
ncbi:hypothetical protein D9757_012625 [Collybiopsis confluens]|uniref:purine-nucleoside phosphorylase n=1 Tax=Collybiopsis confluens TaxID=2823264 RepID=A0A8H5D285_9AGAR|nr:hypothetical protein D9757_012625 [Collybiopsis confluens]